MGSENDTESGGAPVAATSPSGSRRVLSFLRSKNFREELVIVGSILALCCFVRWYRLSPIDFYEDTVSKWHFVRQWFYNNDFGDATWTHHQARFGVNVPVFLTQLLFGRSPYVYYVAPLLAVIGQVLGLYYLGRRLGGRAVGVTAALLRATFTGMDQGSCQLLPDGFGGTAMVFACYFMVRYDEAAVEKRTRWVVATGLVMVWAYLIKESNVLFAPGVVVSVWLSKRRFRDVLVLCLIPAAAVLLETAAFSLLTNYPSRFAIVDEAHGEATVEFFELFDRVAKLSSPWQMLFWLWLPAVVWLWGSKDKRLRPVYLVPASFIFFMTFLVRRVDPIVLWTRFINRYWDAVGPLMMLGVAVFAVELVRRLWLAKASERWRLGLEKHRWVGFIALLVVCATCGSVTYMRSASQHATEKIRNMTTIVNDAYRRNLPIVEDRPSKREEEEVRVRPLKLIYGVFINDEYLASSDIAERGELPDILDAVKTSGENSYILREHRAYRGKELEKIIEQGCAVRVTHRNKSTIVQRTTKLPSSCRAPRGKAFRR